MFMMDVPDDVLLNTRGAAIVQYIKQSGLDNKT